MSSEPTAESVETLTPRLLYSVGETAEVLSVGRSTIFRLIADGELATVKVRGRRMVPRNALDAFVEGLTG